MYALFFYLAIGRNQGG